MSEVSEVNVPLHTPPHTPLYTGGHTRTHPPPPSPTGVYITHHFSQAYAPGHCGLLTGRMHMSVLLGCWFGSEARVMSAHRNRSVHVV